MRDLNLCLATLFHVGNYLTDFCAEAVVLLIHRQFVVKPDWMDHRLCPSNTYSLGF